MDGKKQATSMFFDMQQMAIECISPLLSIYNERNHVPTSAAVALSSAWDRRRKKVTMGKDAQGKQTQKGDGMFANRTPFAKHQPTDSAQITLTRHRKTGEPSAHVPKKMEQLG